MRFRLVPRTWRRAQFAPAARATAPRRASASGQRLTRANSSASTPRRRSRSRPGPATPTNYPLRAAPAEVTLRDRAPGGSGRTPTRATCLRAPIWEALRPGVEEAG